jgi:hypothetical protein
MEDISRYLTGWMAHYRLCTPEAVQVRIPVDREHGFRLIVNINSSRS